MPYRQRPIGTRLQPCAYLPDSCFQLALELFRCFPVHSACTPPIHLLPRLNQKLRREQMRQRCESKSAVCLGSGRNLFQFCGHPSPISGYRRCFPGPASRPVPPLPPVRGFPALRVLSADPTSTTASAFLWMVLSVRILDPSFAFIKTAVDLPGSVSLPFPSVPCSQTPPESPASSPLSDAYFCLPSIRPCRPPVYRV